MPFRDSAVFIGVVLNLTLTDALGLVRAETTPGPKAEEAVWRFELIGMQEPLEHTFYFENRGEEMLQLTNVTATAPFQFIKASARVAPGQKGRVMVRLGEPREKGDCAGHVEVAFKNPGVSNLVFQCIGKIIPSIE